MEHLRHLNNSKEYYRRYSMVDKIVIAVVAVMIITGVGLPLAFIVAIIYTLFLSKVEVSDTHKWDERFWISHSEWNKYYKSHGRNFFFQFKPHDVATYKDKPYPESDGNTSEKTIF